MILWYVDTDIKLQLWTSLGPVHGPLIIESCPPIDNSLLLDHESRPDQKWQCQKLRQPALCHNLTRNPAWMGATLGWGTDTRLGHQGRWEAARFCDEERLSPIVQNVGLNTLLLTRDPVGGALEVPEVTGQLGGRHSPCSSAPQNWLKNKLLGTSINTLRRQPFLYVVLSCLLA